MRILFFAPYFYPYISGTTIAPFKILKHLAQKNQVKVLTFNYDKNLLSKETVSGFSIIRMDYLFKISKGFISPQSLVSFFRNVLWADIVILSTPNFEGLPLAVLGKIFGKKIFSILQCEVYLAGSLSNRIINFFLNCSVYVQLVLSKTIVTYTRDYVDRILAGKIFRKKIKVIFPPIEKHQVDYTAFQQFKTIRKNKILLGFAGRIAQEKGLEYLIEAARILKTKGMKLALLFAGPTIDDVVGEKIYNNKILSLLEKSGVEYKLLGKLSDMEMAAFYKTIDILILPSVNKTEAFGLVQIEAMLLGTPVIASNLPGVRMPVKMTKMGLIVESRNKRTLAAAISEIVRNRKRFTNAKLTNNAARIFSISRVLYLYNRLFSEK